MDKKTKTACFTGHREYHLPTIEIKRRLNKLLDYLISRGIIYYGWVEPGDLIFLQPKQ